MGKLEKIGMEKAVINNKLYELAWETNNIKKAERIKKRIESNGLFLVEIVPEELYNRYGVKKTNHKGMEKIRYKIYRRRKE